MECYPFPLRTNAHHPVVSPKYPHLAVKSEWAKPYLAHLPPALQDRAGSVKGNQAEKAIELTKKAGKKYPKGFDGLQAKNVDMSGYLAQVDLTKRQLECYSLLKEYGLPLAEVAGRLGIDRKTAYEHIHKAEKKINLQFGKRRDQFGRIKKAPIAD